MGLAYNTVPATPSEGGVPLACWFPVRGTLSQYRRRGLSVWGGCGLCTQSEWRCGLCVGSPNWMGVASQSVSVEWEWPLSVSLSVFTCNFISAVRRRDDCVFGLCKECVSCVWFHIPLLALDSPRPVFGRLRPVGYRRTGNTSIICQSNLHHKSSWNWNKFVLFFFPE